MRIEKGAEEFKQAILRVMNTKTENMEITENILISYYGEGVSRPGLYLTSSGDSSSRFIELNVKDYFKKNPETGAVTFITDENLEKFKKYVTELAIELAIDHTREALSHDGLYDLVEYKGE